MNIKKLNEELNKLQMNEMSVAWLDRTANRCCWVENPTGYNNKYFKYLNSFSYGKANKVARISLLNAKYLNHSDSKDNWVLTNKEKKELMQLMQSKSRRLPELTNWQLTLIQYNLDNFGIYEDETINGTFDKTEYPNAFSIDFPMPNYLQLEEN